MTSEISVINVDILYHTLMNVDEPAALLFQYG